MTLDELRQKISNDDMILSIGSRSGYMFIGTRQDYDREIDAISTEVKTALEDKLGEVETTIQSLQAALVAGHTRKGSISPDSVRKKLAEFEEKQRVLAETLAIFKPLREREVIDLYSRINPNDGTCVIVEGGETGEAWFKEEYDKTKKRKRRYGR